MTLHKFLALLCFTCWFQANLLAQSGSLSGLVLDPSGAVVAGARIDLLRAGSNLEIKRVTDASGLYFFSELPPGEYRVTVSQEGFRRVERKLNVNVASRLTVDFRLILGETSSSVEVEETALVVNRETAAVETVFDRSFVQNLPLNGRSFQSLLELTPGIVLAAASITNPGQFAVNGQRTNANYFMVDGVSGNIAASASATFTQQAAGALPGLTILGGSNALVSIDALQEFRVTTSSYAAEYGRSPGAQVVLVTRSGSNRYTGSLYDYFRNERLDANDWFANRNNVSRLPLRQNNFGGVFGGPVYIPGVFNGKDHTFFFASYEGLRMRQPQAAIRSTLVPSQQARDRATGAAREVFNAFPLPNAPLLPGDRQDPNLARYVSGVSNPSRFDAFSIRGDHYFTSRAQAFFRFNNAPSSSLSRVFANQDNENEINSRTATGGLTWTFSPTLVSDLRLNWSHSEGAFNFAGRAIDGAVLPSDALLFGPNLPRATSSVTLNLISGASPVSLSQGRTLGNDQQQWNIVENITLIRGRHHMKFGFDYRLLLPEVKARSLGVSHAFTTRSNSNGVTDLLETGRVNTSIQALAPVTGFRIHNISSFGQDTWRVNARLTLTYGIRWEINPAPSGRLLPFRLDQVRNLLTADLAPPNTELYRTTWTNVAPRVGVAWALNDRGDFVLRAGGGVFYDLGNGPALQGYTSYPYNSNRALPNIPWPVPVADLTPAPFNQNPPYNATFRVMDPGIQLPYTVQWNVSLERSLGPNQTMTASYVASRAQRLLRTEILRNQTAFGQPVYPVINPSAFASTASVFLTRNEASSRYHSLQLQFQRRMTRGLQAMASYTWSKALDNISDEVTAGLPVDGIGSFNLALDREFGPAAFDINHIFTGAVTWRIPGAGQRGFLHSLTTGWSLDGIVRLRSGFPFTVITQTIDPLNFGSNRRVDYVGEPNWIDDPNVAAGKRLNPAAFRIPTESGRQGTLGRNALRAFPARQFDLAGSREFSLTETLRLQFKAEMFNAFNHPNFGTPNSALNPFPDAFFGQSTQMLGRSLGGGGTSGGLSPLYQVGGPRSVQLSLRLSF